MSRTLPIRIALSARLNGALRADLVRHVAFVALAVLMAAPVMGQTVATSFDELRFKVKAGDTVYFTDESGKSEQKARILDLSVSSLAVSIGGVRRDLVESNVMRIRQPLPDTKKNGALIGFLVGAAGKVAGAKACSGHQASSCLTGVCSHRRPQESRAAAAEVWASGLRNDDGLDPNRGPWDAESMTQATKKLLEEIEALPDQDRSELVAELARRIASAPHDLPSDTDLAAAADRLFAELDRRESSE